MSQKRQHCTNPSVTHAGCSTHLGGRSTGCLDTKPATAASVLWGQGARAALAEQTSALVPTRHLRHHCLSSRETAPGQYLAKRSQGLTRERTGPRPPGGKWPHHPGHSALEKSVWQSVPGCHGTEGRTLRTYCWWQSRTLTLTANQERVRGTLYSRGHFPWPWRVQSCQAAERAPKSMRVRAQAPDQELDCLAK